MSKEKPSKQGYPKSKSGSHLVKAEWVAASTSVLINGTVCATVDKGPVITTDPTFCN